MPGPPRRSASANCAKPPWQVATRSLKRTCTDPQTGVAPREDAGAAMCVRSVDDQCVLQFTLVHAAGCVLHRRTSRVIHRRELFSYFDFAVRIYICISRDERTCGKTTKRRGSGREHSLPSKPRRDRPLYGRPPPGQAVEHLPLGRTEGGSTDAGTGRSAGTPPRGTWDVSLQADDGGPTRLSEAGDGH